MGLVVRKGHMCTHKCPQKKRKRDQNLYNLSQPCKDTISVKVTPRKDWVISRNRLRLPDYMHNYEIKDSSLSHPVDGILL